MSAYSTNQTSATIGASDVTILGSNPSRHRLTVTPPSAGRVTLAFGRAAVLDAGITIQAGTSPRTFTDDELGDLCHGEIHAIADAAGRTVGILETFSPRL
jgi:hypothetical protein